MGIFSLWIFGKVLSLGAVGLICLRYGFFVFDIMCVHWFMVFFIIFWYDVVGSCGNSDILFSLKNVYAFSCS